MKTIQLDQDILAFLTSRATDIGEPVSRILRRELHLPEPPNLVAIDDDVYQLLVSKMVDLKESPSDILRRELHVSHDHDHPGHIVEFHIPLGTSNGPWNVREQPVVATVGDTLRIVNDDSVDHRVHTSGIPFPHPADRIPPEGTADYLLTTPFDLQPLSDHQFGPTAQFWIKVTAAS